MDTLIKKIGYTDDNEIDMLLHAVLQQYGELHPELEMRAIYLCKSEDRKGQLDRIISMLEKMKTFP